MFSRFLFFFLLPAFATFRRSRLSEVSMSLWIWLCNHAYTYAYHMDPPSPTCFPHDARLGLKRRFLLLSRRGWAQLQCAVQSTYELLYCIPQTLHYRKAYVLNLKRLQLQLFSVAVVNMIKS